MFRLAFRRHFLQTVDVNTHGVSPTPPPIPLRSRSLSIYTRLSVFSTDIVVGPKPYSEFIRLCAVLRRLAISPNNIIFRVGWFHSFNFFVHECKLLWKLRHLSFFKYYVCSDSHNTSTIPHRTAHIPIRSQRGVPSELGIPLPCWPHPAYTGYDFMDYGTTLGMRGYRIGSGRERNAIWQYNCVHIESVATHTHTRARAHLLFRSQ